MTKTKTSLISLFLLLSILFMQPFLSFASTTVNHSEWPASIEAGAAGERALTLRLLDEWKEKGSLTKLPVMVWFEDIDHSGIEEIAIGNLQMTTAEFEKALEEDSLSIREIQQYIMTKREESSRRYHEYNTFNSQKYFSDENIIYVSSFSPVVLSFLTEEEAKALALEPSVQFIDLYYEDNSEEIEIANAVTRASAAQSNYGYTGDEIKIGIFEVNIPNASSPVFSGLNVVSSNGTVSLYSMHGNSVLEIVASIAPDALYYLADSSLNTIDVPINT